MSFEKETGRDLYFAQLEKELAELIDQDTGLLDEKYAIEVDCPVCHSRENKTLFIKTVPKIHWAIDERDLRYKEIEEALKE